MINGKSVQSTAIKSQLVISPISSNCDPANMDLASLDETFQFTEELAVSEKILHPAGGADKRTIGLQEAQRDTAPGGNQGRGNCSRRAKAHDKVHQKERRHAGAER